MALWIYNEIDVDISKFIPYHPNSYDLLVHTVDGILTT